MRFLCGYTVILWHNILFSFPSVMKGYNFMQKKEPIFNKETIRVIIGLGNPGAKYHKTRHNIGFRVVDEFESYAGVSLQSTNDMEYAQVRLTDQVTGAEMQPIYLIKPLTFMNNSGQVIPWLTKKGIKPDEILVIHDELEKPFGYIGTKFDGSAKGHNGLRSIIERIGTGFWRLRIGIGRPERKEDVGNYVLEPFNQQEENNLEGIIDLAVKKILM